MNHLALFDILFLGKNLQSKNDGFTLSEIQILSYLSCLLSIYSGNLSKEWSYIFTKTEYGYPFSSDLIQGIDFLVKEKYISKTDNHFSMTKTGFMFSDKLQNLNSYNKRKEFLETSINCLSLTPFGVIRDSLFADPVLLSARSKTKTILLEENNYSTTILFDQFKDLKIAINNEYKSLIIPAITWLSGNLKQQIG